MANTTSTTTTGIDPAFQKYYNEVFKQGAANVFATDAEGKVTGMKPFQPYQGEQIAGFTPDQLAVQQQMAALQTPQGFGQSTQGLQTAQQMAFGAANQGLNQAFGYNPQPQTSLAIPQQAWFPSGSNQPQQVQQPAAPQQPPRNEPQTLDNGNGGFGPPQPAPAAFTQGMQSTRSGTSPHMQAEINRRLALRNMPLQTFADGGAVNTAQAYNTEFSRLNPQIPLNAKWDAAGQQSYLQQLVANNPTQYKAPGTTFGATNTPVIPEYQNMGVTNTGGVSTFSGPPAGAAVSSATPQISGQGLVDTRLASRGLPPQTTAPTAKPLLGQATTPSFMPNGNGGFGPPAVNMPNAPQQPLNNGNGGFGPAAPMFGQQPDASAYQSQYQQGVTDVALREGQRQADLQRQAGAMSSIGRGTFGGARQALMQTEADRGNAQNMAAIQALGSQAGFQNAQQQFNADRASNIGVQTQNQNVALQQQQMNQQGQQFQAGLGRDIGLAGLNAGIGSSTNLGNLSSSQQQADLARLNAQGGTAAQQQLLQQQMNDRAREDYYRAQQYPQQQLGLYSDMLRGNQGAAGTVGTTTTPGASTGAQILGGAVALGGMYAKNPEGINSGISSLYDWWNKAPV